MIYYGERRWDGPTELAQMMDLPVHLGPDYFNNYKINLIVLNEKSEYPFHQKSVRDFFTLVYSIYNLEKGDMPSSMEHVSIEVARAAAVVTGVEERYRDVLVNREEAIVNMCEAVKRVMEKERNEGRAEGIEKGMQKGMQEGRRRVLITALKSGYEKAVLLGLGFTDAEIEKTAKICGIEIK